MAGPGPTVPPTEREPQPGGTQVPASSADAVASGGATSRQTFASMLAATGILLIVAGIFLALFPFIADFTSAAAAANEIVCGGVAIFLGALRLMGVRHPVVGYAVMAVGLWLFASSFFIGELAREAWTERSLGAIVFFLGLLGLERPARTASSAPR